MSATLMPVEDFLSEVATALLPEGSLLVFPTDTLYGLGVRPDDESAIQRLRSLKSRPRPQPFSLHLGSKEFLVDYCSPLNAKQQRWLNQLLPGPFTVLLPAHRNAPPDAVLLGKIGLRVPDSPAFRQIAGVIGPLLGTSVNRAGEAPLNSVAEILTGFGAEISLFLKSEQVSKGESSAVVDLCEARPRVRRGQVPPALLKALTKTSGYGAEHSA